MSRLSSSSISTISRQTSLLKTGCLISGLASLLACGPAAHDCDPVKYQRGYDAAVQHFYTPAMDYLDVFCVAKGWLTARKYCVCECYTVSRATWPHRARYLAEAEYVDVCIVHEQYHAYLEANGWPPCYDHTAACGWDAKYFDEVGRELKSSY